MKLHQFVIGLVIFGLIVIVGFNMIGDVNTNYNLSLNDSEYGDVYNTIDDTYDLGRSMEDSSLGSEIDDEESWESMTKGSYSAVRQVTGGYSLVGDILATLSSKLGIPQFIITAALTVLMISIVFGIIYMVFRFKP